MHTVCYFHLVLGLSIFTVLGEKYKFWRLLALPLTSAATKLLFVSLHRPNILLIIGPDVLSTLFCKTLCACVLSSKSEQVVFFLSTN